MKKIVLGIVRTIRAKGLSVRILLSHPGLQWTRGKCSNVKMSTSCLLLALTVPACTNLKPVQEFGKNASAVAGYRGVAEDYPAVLERLKLYGDTGPAVSDEKVTERQRDAKRLSEAQHVIQDYAKALGALAADDLAVYDEQVDALNKSLVDGKFVTSSETEGYAKAAKTGLRLFTDMYRRSKIKSLVTTYNRSL
jgi:hypothetical protein